MLAMEEEVGGKHGRQREEGGGGDRPIGTRLPVVNVLQMLGLGVVRALQQLEGMCTAQ
jgi:hypothetical protein